MTNIEHFWSRVMNITHFSSHMTKLTSNTAIVFHFVFIGKTPSVTFVNASGFVGDTKRLRLPRFDGYLIVSDDLESPLRLILHPVMNPPPQKVYIK